MVKVASSLVTFTKINQRFLNHCGLRPYQLLNFARTGARPHIEFLISIPGTTLRTSKLAWIESGAHTPVPNLKSTIRKGARGAQTKGRSRRQFSWEPRSPRQLLKIILLLSKTKHWDRKLPSRFQNSHFLIFGEKMAGFISVECLVRTMKKTQKTYSFTNMISML